MKSAMELQLEKIEINLGTLTEINILVISHTRDTSSWSSGSFVQQVVFLTMSIVKLDTGCTLIYGQPLRMFDTNV